MYENTILKLIENGIAYTVKYNVGKYYTVLAQFDPLGLFKPITMIFDYKTGIRIA